MNNIYQDIKNRTNGDIYIGVVGPVRVGKSTFITRFMEEFVIPKIANKNAKACTIDELPQSSDGVTIMTTQPKFVPAESVSVEVGNVNLSVRLIDCVGYFVSGAQGHKDGEKVRMVKTPWSSDLMPLDKAAELGTRKVISDHSTISVLMTTDGSFGDIKKENFTPAVDKLASELKEYKKPFVIVLNSKTPKAEETVVYAKKLEEKYGVGVVSLDATKMEEKEVQEVFEKVLTEFPLVSLELKMPAYLTALPFENPIIAEITEELRHAGEGVEKIGQFDKNKVLFANSEKFEPLVLSSVELGTGKILFDLIPKENLFYEVLSSQCGLNIQNDFDLVSQMQGLAKAKKEYDKLENALLSVQETGYGIVLPSLEQMTFDEPEMVKQGGGRWGVRLKATAPSLHIMRVDIETEISPMIGSQEQSQNLVEYLNEQSKTNPNGIWDTNMFGKSMQELMKDGLSNKLSAMPVEAQKKMRKTLTRIVNEGKGGIICILL